LNIFVQTVHQKTNKKKKNTTPFIITLTLYTINNIN
jgi:hypothetical protein